MDSEAVLSPPVTVEITTPDAGAEVFLLDGRLQMVARGVGELRTQQPPGVYKLKLQAGQNIAERLIALKSEPFRLHLGALQLDSPVPIENTAHTSIAMMEAAEQASQEVHQRIGEGSQLFIFVRGYVPEVEEFDAAHSPAQGLVLCGADGEALVDLQSQGISSRDGEPYSACVIELNPGCYRLAVTIPGGRTFEQTVVTGEGWRTNIFLQQRRSYVTPDERRPDLAAASISMSPVSLPFSRYNSQARLVETARLALVNRRAVVEGELKEFLRLKFDDPVLGILAGHLVLGRRPVDTELLSEVVVNLRKLIGAKPHPDVEALAQAAGLPVEYNFAIPPMLRRSWPVILETSVSRHDLTPTGTLAHEIAMHITNQDPWLIWERPSADASRSPDFVEALTWMLWPETGRKGTPTLQQTLSRWYLAGFRAVVRELPLLGYGYRKALDIQVEKLKTDEQMKQLTQRLGLPRSRVEEMLDAMGKGLAGT